MGDGADEPGSIRDGEDEPGSTEDGDMSLRTKNCVDSAFKGKPDRIMFDSCRKNDT